MADNNQKSPLNDTILYQEITKIMLERVKQVEQQKGIYYTESPEIEKKFTEKNTNNNQNTNAIASININIS